MTLMNNKLGRPIGKEGRSVYILEGDRYVVCLAGTYGNNDDKVTSVEQAAAAMLALTLDKSSTGTMWFVFDRKTGDHHILDQSEFEEIIHDRGWI